MRSKFTSFLAKSATANTAFTHISAICSFNRPTLHDSVYVCAYMCVRVCVYVH